MPIFAARQQTEVSQTEEKGIKGSHGQKYSETLVMSEIKDITDSHDLHWTC